MSVRSNLPRAVRHLRRRRGWRQLDLADASGVSRQVVSRLERGESLGTLKLRHLSRLADALDASVDVTIRWRGEELDRLIDSAHAELQQSTVRLLEGLGWATRVEVSFSHYGERGRADILAWHGGRRVLLIIEVKSAIGNLGETLGRLDVKVRLGSVLSGTVGWPSALDVIPVLVVGDSRRARREVSEHDAVMSRFGLRGRQARAWLRRPAEFTPTGLLLFAKVPNSRSALITRNSRVRTVRSRA
jgi:transcriptional regulator with XRE-family HTH domain